MRTLLINAGYACFIGVYPRSSAANNSHLKPKTSRPKFQSPKLKPEKAAPQS